MNDLRRVIITSLTCFQVRKQRGFSVSKPFDIFFKKLYYEYDIVVFYLHNSHCYSKIENPPQSKLFSCMRPSVLNH